MGEVFEFWRLEREFPEGVCTTLERNDVIVRVPNYGNLDNNDLLIYFELVTIIFTIEVSFLQLGVSIC